jgi:arabinan endo-1,5-alpha-L-arabinosidase
MIAMRFMAALAALLPFAGAAALEGQPGMHDPSTVFVDRGRYYALGTGAGLPVLVSDDGWNWRRHGPLMQALPEGKPGAEVLARGGNNTWAPDVIRLDGRIYVYYSAPATQPRSAIGLLVGTTFDNAATDYHWEDAGPVVWSDGIEDSNAIDPGVFIDTNDGRLWLTYGSYFGFIRLVELDPRTGLRKFPNRKPLDIAINSEASIIIHHDKWYYLLVTHGSCCQGANSTYNIRMGRSRKVTGPYLDNMGVDMIEGGGKLFAGSTGRFIGPGHFGLLEMDNAVQKFSLHYEADLDRGGISVLDIRPLRWRDGWPIAGDNFHPGEYIIESARTGTVLELAVQGEPVGGPRVRPPGPPPADPPALPPVPMQQAMQMAEKWPTGEIALRLAPAMLQAQQRWRITPVSEAGGYPGAPWLRISIAGTERTLTATRDGELVTMPAFTGAAEQLWRIEQLADASYRLVPKSGNDPASPVALSAIGSSTPTLTVFQPASDRQRWNIRTP